MDNEILEYMRYIIDEDTKESIKLKEKNINRQDKRKYQIKFWYFLYKLIGCDNDMEYFE